MNLSPIFPESSPLSSVIGVKKENPQQVKDPVMKGIDFREYMEEEEEVCSSFCTWYLYNNVSGYNGKRKGQQSRQNRRKKKTTFAMIKIFHRLKYVYRLSLLNRMTSYCLQHSLHQFTRFRVFIKYWGPLSSICLLFFVVDEGILTFQANVSQGLGYFPFTSIFIMFNSWIGSWVWFEGILHIQNHPYLSPSWATCHGLGIDTRLFSPTKLSEPCITSMIAYDRAYIIIILLSINNEDDDHAGYKIMTIMILITIK